MKRIRITAVALLLLAGVGTWYASPAQAAPDAETMQTARELVAVVPKDATRQIVARLSAQFWPPIEQSLKSK